MHSFTRDRRHHVQNGLCCASRIARKIPKAQFSPCCCCNTGYLAPSSGRESIPTRENQVDNNPSWTLRAMGSQHFPNFEMLANLSQNISCGRHAWKTCRFGLVTCGCCFATQVYAKLLGWVTLDRFVLNWKEKVAQAGMNLVESGSKPLLECPAIASLRCPTAQLFGSPWPA